MNCVECFKPLENGHICENCQGIVSNMNDYFPDQEENCDQ